MPASSTPCMPHVRLVCLIPALPASSPPCLPHSHLACLIPTMPASFPPCLPHSRLACPIPTLLTSPTGPSHTEILQGLHLACLLTVTLDLRNIHTQPCGSHALTLASPPACLPTCPCQKGIKQRLPSAGQRLFNLAAHPGHALLHTCVLRKQAPAR
eukprot:462257-Pelagomonas_calceolata.AAC.1